MSRALVTDPVRAVAVYRFRMRLRLVGLLVLGIAVTAAEARAQQATEAEPPQPPTGAPLLPPAPAPAPAPAAAPAPAPATAPATVNEREVEELERLREDSLLARRALADSVLIAGLASVAAGAAFMIPDAEDQGFRYAGLNTAIFGAVNTLVGALALHGIGEEKAAWRSPEARAARRTPEGLVRARVHAAIDERRESVSHAVNLGLGCAYAAVAGTAVLASQLGVEHPNRWLGSGIAVGLQALFLIGVDYVGLKRSAHYHRAFVEGFAPSVSITPTAHGTDMRMGLEARF